MSTAMGYSSSPWPCSSMLGYLCRDSCGKERTAVPQASGISLPCHSRDR